MGNHEDMLLANLDDYPSPYKQGRRELHAKSFFVNGGRATLASYGVATVRELPQDHLEFFKSLALSWEDDLRYYVHAGVKPGVPLAQQDHHDQLWIRGEFLSWTESFEKIHRARTYACRPGGGGQPLQPGLRRLRQWDIDRRGL